MPEIIALDPFTAEPWDPRTAAARGAALLDRLPWPGWRQLVAVDQLDMSDGTYRGQPGCVACVGAQLDYHRQLVDLGDDEAEGDYVLFLQALFPAVHEVGYTQSKAFAIHYGFTTPDTDTQPKSWEADQDLYDRLTGAWRELLNA